MAAASGSGEPLAVAGDAAGRARRPPRRFRVVRRAAARAAGRRASTPPARGGRRDDRPAAVRRRSATTVRGLRVSGAIADLPARAEPARRPARRGDRLRRPRRDDRPDRARRARAGSARCGGSRRRSTACRRARVRFATGRRKRATAISFNATRPLGAVDLVATSGRAPPRAPAGRDVVYYRDVRDRAACGGRARVAACGFGRTLRERRRRGAGRSRRPARRPRASRACAGCGSCCPSPGAGRSRALTVERPADRRRRAGALRLLAAARPHGQADGLPGKMAVRLRAAARCTPPTTASAPIGAIHLAARGGAAARAGAPRAAGRPRPPAPPARRPVARAARSSRRRRTGPSGRCRWRSRRAGEPGRWRARGRGCGSPAGRGSRCGCAGCGASSCGRPRRCASTRRSPASASP